MIAILIKLDSYSQKIFIGYGQTSQYSNQSVPLINGRNIMVYGGNQTIIGIEYARRKINYLSLVSRYEGHTTLWISDTKSTGFGGSRMTRIDVGVSYNIVNRCRYYIHPFFMIGLQHSKKIADIYKDAMKVNGPNYFEKDIASDSYNMTQVVPSAGMRIGVRFLKRMSFDFCMQGVYAFKTYQKVYFHYMYQSDPTLRYAVFDSQGTGVFTSINLGIQLNKDGNIKRGK